MRTSTRNCLRLMSLCALALALTLSAGTAVALGAEPAAALAQTPTPAPAPATKALSSDAAARPTTGAESAAYAERERNAAPELARFEGGDVIIIGATTLGVILIIVLLVLVLR